MSDAPEFSRLVRIDTIGDAPRRIEVAADEAERWGLARRFDLASIDRLEGSVEVSKVAGGILARGRIAAAVVQHCVATRDPVAAAIDEPFALRFVEASVLAAAEEVELSDDDCDVVGYDGQAIDLGEALAQTLALALDPFPRAPDAETALRAAGVVSEEEAGPFGALAGLRGKLGGES